MKYLVNLFNRIRNVFTPPRPFSWKTLVLLSLFSWVMSTMAAEWLRVLLSTFGWIFLILGSAWGTWENPVQIGYIPVGPWLTGALVSIFIFGSWREDIPPIAIITWPIISVTILTIPQFISSGKFLIPPPKKRQQLIVLIGSNLLISCWFQLHFLVQDWLRQYPTLLADNFNQSVMLVRLEPSTQIPLNGVLILDTMEQDVRQELAGQPWPQVEKWLLNAQQQVAELGKQVIQENLSTLQESAFWRVDGRVLNAGQNYDLELLAIWEGPSSNPDKSYLSKTCEIAQIPETTVAEVTCGQVTSPNTETSSYPAVQQ